MNQIDEVSRRGYKIWGIIDHNGTIITGEDHPHANTHSDLLRKLPKDKRHKAVEYAHSKDGLDLMVRTCSKESIINCMKNWNKIPKGFELVTHDHSSSDVEYHADHYGSPVRQERALANMNRILMDYDR